ncbi:ABC transporter ATP-binding protein [soil metagenome]
MAGVEVEGLSLAYPGPAGRGVDVLRDVDLRVEPGTVLALLGPSGCGKTTLLRAVAGLEVPSAGVVRVGGRTLNGPDALVPPERRRVCMVCQYWGLFPHLNVAANVAYGLPRAARRHGPRVAEILELVGLTGFGDRLPGTLSGGQQQRVALARALAPRPSVLLLDEPFSNLDTALRASLRAEVHALLESLDVTTVFVTHDQEEAFVLGDEVAVMAEGAVVQQATPAELYLAPATPWVARFVGEANLLGGTAGGRRVATEVGPVPLGGDGLDGPVEVLVRPELLALAAGGPSTVTRLEYYCHDTVYVLDVAGGTVRARAGGSPRFAKGDPVTVTYAGGPTVAWPVRGG